MIGGADPDPVAPNPVVEPAAPDALNMANLAEQLDVETDAATITATIAKQNAEIAQLQAQVQALTNASASAPKGETSYRIGHLEKYSGEGSDMVEDWLDATAMTLRVNGIPEDQRVRCAVQLLKGEAATTVARLDGFDALTAGWNDLCTVLRASFGSQDRSVQARYSLDVIEQTGELADYIRDFQSLVGQVGRASFSQEDLVHRFRQGLVPRLQDKCLHRGDGSPWTNLNDLITFCTNVWAAMTAAKGKAKAKPAGPNPQPERGDAKKAPYKNGKRKSQPNPSKSSSSGGKRHQTDLSAISKEEKQRRFTNKLCLKCGQSGHRVSDCKNAINLTDAGISS